MADVIRKATNRFTKGLVMDFSPENTKNEVLTHALNATLLTFNGNELSLQNDMGNARVETACLPEGYMPVGTCEYGGIIYIVSYNPLEDKSQIGCFPSPERNISSEELGISEVLLSPESFQRFENDSPTGEILNTSKHVLLRNDNLNPGDKFLVYADPSIYDELLVDLYKSSDGKDFSLVSHPIIALNLVSIEDSGRIVYLNSDLRQYQVNSNLTTTNKYHILGETPKAGSLGMIDLDNYRNVLSSGYNVFRSKTSGKLAILAELVTVDSYSVTHSVVPKKMNINGVEQTIGGFYDVIIHTEVEPFVTPANYLQIPKLSYYYLKDSQGCLEIAEKQTVDLFDSKNDLNSAFLLTNLSDIYVNTDEKNPMDLDTTLEAAGGKFYINKSGTYHSRMIEHEGFIEPSDEQVYTKFTENAYHRVKKHQILNASGTNFNTYFKQHLNAKFYKYDPSKVDYTIVEKDATLNNDEVYYVKITTYEYFDAKRDSKYLEKPLYKLYDEFKIADNTVIKDSSIEKFQESKVYTYKVASSSDLLNYGQVTLYYKEEDSYIKLSGSPDSNVTYYTLKIDTPMVSIGFTPDPTVYKGTMFYYPGSKIYLEASKAELEAYWDFETYEKTNEAPWGAPMVLYYKEASDDYRLATDSETLNFKKNNITLYYKQDYTLIDYNLDLHNDNDPIFVVVPMDAYVTQEEFKPNTLDNYIKGASKPAGDYPKDDPLILCTVSDFIPCINETLVNKDDGTREVQLEASQYPDVKLASVKIPGILSTNGIDLPFKYSYTVVPCMNYGKLDHLAVSNTVDFSNLHAFEQSTFTDWKYHIDGNQLRLTFGAEVFDTYEDYKVDALVLEFYDSWGFVGSLEVTNKKSYSGIFTKLISLNTLGSLSKNKILNNTYTQNFYHNVNITAKENDEGESQFELNGTEVFYTPESGWVNIKEEDNDCGALYFNLIYGVKAYLRRTTKSGFEFIHKKDFVLFTLPIYNDYYYTVSDFSTLVNPKLDMQLTYKLVDNGSQSTYSKNDLVYNGYSETDLELIKAYTAGTLENSELSVVKYCKYVGETSLYLEVGLHEKYSQYGLSYDPVLNNYFKYDLDLVSNVDNSKRFSIESDKYPDRTEKSLLNYSFDDFDENYINFEDSGLGLTNKLFITGEGQSPIKLNYQFIVGYQVQVTDITLKQIETSVMCALLHTDNGETNYSDFDLFLDLNNDVLPKMLYTGGAHNKLEMGLIDLTDTSATTMWKQLSNKKVVYKKDVSANTQEQEGSLYKGDAIQNLYKEIGKYTFFQPHAHVVELDDAYSVNIIKASNDLLYISASDPNAGNWHINISEGDEDRDTSYGRTPSWDLRDNPRYNMAVYTQEQFNNNYGIMSTNYYSLISSKMLGSECGDGGDFECYYGFSKETHEHRVFHGVTAQELKSFYKKFATTMSQIYAYNPDYTSISTYQGNASITDNEVYAVSNIINKDSKFVYLDTDNSEITCVNDFVYIHNMSITKYLKYLDKHSQESLFSESDLVKFEPGFTFCGTKNNPFLLTSLTYKFVPDVSILKDVEPTVGGSYVVKHSDGSINWINGKCRHDILYGYNKTHNKLIPLQVGNYTIESDGSINVDRVKILQSTKVLNLYEPRAAALLVHADGIRMNDITLRLKGSNTKILGSYSGVVMLTDSQIGAPSSLTLTMDSVTSGAEVKFFRFYALDATLGVDINLADQSDNTLFTLLMGEDSEYVDIKEGDVFKKYLVGSIRIRKQRYSLIESNNIQLETYGKPVIRGVIFQILVYTVNPELDLTTLPTDVLATRASVSYYKKTNNTTYSIVDEYKDAVIPLTSITLEDLQYDPLNVEHKLFLNRNKFWYPNDHYGDYNGRIFYRLLPKANLPKIDNGYVDLVNVSMTEAEKNWLKHYAYSWGSSQGTGKPANEWQHNNMLYIYSGPCFMPNSTK